MKQLLLSTLVAILVARSTQLLLFTEFTKMWQDGLEPFKEICIQKTGVKRYLADRVILYGEYVEDPQLKCYINCLGTSWGMVHKDHGTVLVDELLEFAGIHDAEALQLSQIVERCYLQDRVVSDPCETSFRAWKCGWNVFYEAVTTIERRHRKKQTYDDVKLLWQGDVLQNHHICLMESGANPKLGLRYIKYDEFVEDPKLKCYVWCILKKLNVAHENGTEHHDIFHRKVHLHDPTIIAETQLLDKCYSLRHPNPCEQGFQLNKCVFQTIKDHMNAENVKPEL